MVKIPTVTETIRLNILRWFGRVRRMEENGFSKNVLYEFLINKAERLTKE
jgi:hypothetical protein